MSYTLTMLFSFISQKEKEFRDAAAKEAKKLTLRQIVSEIRENPDIAEDIASEMKHEFEEGQPIHFNMRGFKISAYPYSLEVQSSGRILIEFRGSHVRSFYNALRKEINREYDKVRDSLPF